MRVVVLNTLVPFVYGGAEILAKNLTNAIREAGHEVELINLPFKWYPPHNVVDHSMAARLIELDEVNGMPVDRAIGLKFPAWLMRHPKKVMWVVHQHRQAYDLWDSGGWDLRAAPDGQAVRRFIRSADDMVFAEAQSVYTISRNVSKRLKHYSGIDSEPLYSPPDDADAYYTGDYEPYFYFPSRINLLKRQDLVIEALGKTRQPVRVHFAGVADETRYGQELERKAEALGVADRIRWDGRVSNQQKIDSYANCLGVVYPPQDEDYGYVTLEAMLARKAIVTTTDSGGPLEFVRVGENGLIADPTPESLAAAMDELWARPDMARRWGGLSREIYGAMDISWSRIVDTLLK